jgi:hypothetical protein
MRQKTIVIGSSLAVGIIAVIICVGMVTGYAVTQPPIPFDPLSNANTGGQPATAGTIPADSALYIHIDPVSEKTTGDLLIVSGTTNLPEGTSLMVKAGNSNGGAEVRAGSGNANRFSSPIDTACMKPGPTKITVTNMVGNLETGDYRKGDIDATMSFTLAGSYLTTDSPVRAAVTRDDYIRIDAIGDRSVGDQFLVTGTTSLPVGTEFIWEVTPASFTTEPARQTGTFTGSMGNSQVTKGEGNINRVSFAMDTSVLLPTQYNVSISMVTGDLSAGDFRTGEPSGSIFFTLKKEPASAGSGQYISIDPVSDKTTGDLLIVSGSTNLPAGTILMVNVGSSGVGYGGDTIVRAGTGGTNRFSAPVDTAILKPGTLTITVTQMLGDVEKGDYRMGTLNGTTTIILNGTYLGAETPVQATTTKDDYIRINAIGNRSTGDQFLITGTTSLPVGTTLIWQVMPSTGTVPVVLDLNARGIMANNAVTKGDGAENRVSLAVDTTDHPPGEYIVIVGEMKGDMETGDIRIGDLVGSALFNLK